MLWLLYPVAEARIYQPDNNLILFPPQSMFFQVD